MRCFLGFSLLRGSLLLKDSLSWLLIDLNFLWFMIQFWQIVWVYKSINFFWISQFVNREMFVIITSPFQVPLYEKWHWLVCVIALIEQKLWYNGLLCEAWEKKIIHQRFSAQHIYIDWQHKEIANYRKFLYSQFTDKENKQNSEIDRPRLESM